MLRTFGKTTAKLRVMANDFRRQFDEALKEAELGDLKKVADDVRALNPTNEIKKALSPMEKAAQDVRAGLDAAMKPAAKPQPSPEAPSASDKLQPSEPVKAAATAIAGAAPAKPRAKAKTTDAPAATAKPGGTAAAKRAGTKPVAQKPKVVRKPRAAKSTSGGDVS